MVNIVARDTLPAARQCWAVHLPYT